MAMALGSRWPISSIHLILVRDDGGMDNLVEFLNPRSRAAGRSKRGFRQPGTIDASVGIQNLAAEAADDFIIDRLAGLHERVRDGIGLDEMRSEFDEHLADSGFAARDAAGEAEF